MDIKDNAWTRNFHQKLDVVCQEVDEFVSMGTIKYVENQVQTLGGTVKGFCSNVFQDFLPPALPNPVNHDAGTVPQEIKFLTETYKKSVSNLKEKYADTHTKSLPSDLSNPVNLDAESVPPKGKHATQNYNKPLIIIKEKYADIASKRISTKQDSVHHVPPFYRLNNVKKTTPLPTEGHNKITKALFPLARDESALVHDNVKTSVAGYIVSDCEGLVAKERSLSEDSNSDIEGLVAKERSFTVDSNSDFERLVAKENFLSEDLNSDFKGLVAKEKFLSEDSNSDFGLVAREKFLSEDLNSELKGLVAKDKSLSEDSNCIGINDETSLVFVTEDDYHSHEITDEAVSAAVDESVRVCSSVKERTSDTFFDDCHCKILDTPESSEVECSFSSGCQVVEPTLFSSTSSLSNDSYYQSEFYTTPHETENFVYDLIDSVSSVSETPGHADEFKTDISDPNMKTIDLSEKRKLHESCGIVDNMLLAATYCTPRRHRSYKQMIKDAYTSTKRLTKEYELLGIMYEDIDKEPVQHEKHSRLPSISKRTPGNGHSLTEDLGDFDWELL